MSLRQNQIRVRPPAIHLLHGTLGVSSDMLVISHGGLIWTRNSECCGGSTSEKRRTQALLKYRKGLDLSTVHGMMMCTPTLSDDLERDLTVDLTVMDTASDASEDSRRVAVHAFEDHGHATFCSPHPQQVSVL